VTLALLGAIGLTFSHAQEVWRTGAFFDTDDAMRAVQVRDLLAGQSWFDMTSWRLDPPNGVFSTGRASLTRRSRGWSCSFACSFQPITPNARRGSYFPCVAGDSLPSVPLDSNNLFRPPRHAIWRFYLRSFPAPW